MYIRGEFHGTPDELKETIAYMNDLFGEIESWADARCLQDAIDWLYDIKEAIDYV